MVKWQYRELFRYETIKHGWLTKSRPSLLFIVFMRIWTTVGAYFLCVPFTAAASGEQFWIGELKRFWNIWWTKYQSTSFIIPSSLFSSKLKYSLLYFSVSESSCHFQDISFVFCEVDDLKGLNSQLGAVLFGL
jgi:hypothetical protein